MGKSALPWAPIPAVTTFCILFRTLLEVDMLAFLSTLRIFTNGITHTNGI